MTSEVTTANAISPDSGEHWTAEGAWQVAEGIFRIPLPLPMDGLRAVNVYAIGAPDGLTLIDGGWAIEPARVVLERSLRSLGFRFEDIRRFLVTHIHRDHYTMASVLGHEFGTPIALGIGEKRALELVNDPARRTYRHFSRLLELAGAAHLVDRWPPGGGDDITPSFWRSPDTWLDGDTTIELGQRTLNAVHTPGHTPGHYVFTDTTANLLFAGDHVLPTITPSIGFTAPVPTDSLGTFMASLAKVRALPDLRILPAHGPVAPSSHQRIEELLEFHEERLAQCLAAIRSPTTGYDVAQQLRWTRRQKMLVELGAFDQGLAILETQAHLNLLVARGEATNVPSGDAIAFHAIPITGA